MQCKCKVLTGLGQILMFISEKTNHFLIRHSNNEKNISLLLICSTESKGFLCCWKVFQKYFEYHKMQILKSNASVTKCNFSVYFA